MMSTNPTPVKSSKGPWRKACSPARCWTAWSPRPPTGPGGTTALRSSPITRATASAAASPPPREERVAVPVPVAELGVPREHVDAARERIRGNRAPSSAGRRFWELAGGVLFCRCGRRMATHTVKRTSGKQFYYVCGQRRLGRGSCEHGTKYHPAGETERRGGGVLLSAFFPPPPPPPRAR